MAQIYYILAGKWLDILRMDIDFHFINTQSYELTVAYVKDLDRAIRLHGGKRQLELYMTASLLARMGLEPAKLLHSKKGKPVYPDMGIELSVSHSAGWFAVAKSKGSVGVDIEADRNSLEQGRDYFVNSKEKDLKDLLGIWLIKEAFYKFLGGKINDLKEDVCVTEITTNAGFKLVYNGKTWEGDLLDFGSVRCAIIAMDKIV